MEALLVAIVVWLSANFDLPVADNLPRIEWVPPHQMTTLRYRGLIPAYARETPSLDLPEKPADGRQVVALYRDDSQTIYLPEGWTGQSPAEQSVLVHEMVHHLQNVGRLQYECPQAREKLAYRAQKQWLSLSGKSLSEEFDVDPLTLLVTTACMPPG